MRNSIEALLFVLAQVALVALVLSPFLCAGAGAGSGIGRKVKVFVFAACVTMVFVAAAINIGAATLATAKRAEAPSHAATRTPSMAIRSGAPFVLRLDEEACLAFNFGSLVCATEYRGQLETKTGKWMFTGATKSAPGTITAGYPLPNFALNVLNVWGTFFAFGDDGIARYLEQGVGTIRLQEGHERLSNVRERDRAGARSFPRGACTSFVTV